MTKQKITIEKISKLEPIEEIVEVFKQLDNDGYIIGVCSNSADAAFSRRCCSRSNLISSSDQLKIFFLAHVCDVGAIPPSTALTKSL